MRCCASSARRRSHPMAWMRATCSARCSGRSAPSPRRSRRGATRHALPRRTSPRTSRWPRRTSRSASPGSPATPRNVRWHWRRTTLRPCCCERWPPSPAITIAGRSKAWARTSPPVRVGSPRLPSATRWRARCACIRTRPACSICWRRSCRTSARSRSRCSHRWRTVPLPPSHRKRSPVRARRCATPRWVARWRRRTSRCCATSHLRSRAGTICRPRRRSPHATRRPRWR